MDGVQKIEGTLNGEFLLSGKIPVIGPFFCEYKEGLVILTVSGKRFSSSLEIELLAKKGSSFSLDGIRVGSGFHWERLERQTFLGDLLIRVRKDNRLCAINRIGVEEYIKSVIASEMNPMAPREFLKAHACVARSWVFSRILHKSQAFQQISENSESEIVKIYGSGDHEYYDVCADDHCQRYHGLTKVKSSGVENVVDETEGLVLVYGDSICDTRYSKCCGGITEEYSTAWEEIEIPYLVSVSDSTRTLKPPRTENEVKRWIFSKPKVFCNVTDRALLSKILNETDSETKDFFRWKVTLSAEYLKDLIKMKTGLDVGDIRKIEPLHRGPSGRIKWLLIEGTKKKVKVGKELEIRRILSDSHILSSAFVILGEKDRDGNLKYLNLFGAGWGHGVGMCQIGAANMAMKGYRFEKILEHYFRGTRIVNIYEKEIQDGLHLSGRTR
ncbi:MAG: SpoIID/LytB domain-containing protein [Deltaproteobacteria bacterium]|nr:SpoIID/LytB domain-containing protein [Deltaproteobacteria bacterium]